MSVNAKSPIKKGQNHFFAAKANNLHLNNKTITTSNNNSKITSKTTNPKTNSTPLLNNNSDQTTPSQSPPNLRTNENQISFANAAAKTRNPKKEQAIIIEITDDIQQYEYIYAIAEITKPENILFMSRISKDRFCIFLSSVEMVDRVVNHPTPITINEKPIKIRKYFNPDKRIIISNVCPTIPNETILSEISNIGIIPTSQIIHLRAGVKKEGFAHILSFRRQMFISTETTIILPNSLLINHEGSNHRIFFSDDSLICYKCKKIGHTSASCNEFTEATLKSQNNIEKINDAHTTQHQHTTTSSQTSNIQKELPLENPIKTTETNITDNMEIDLISFTDNKRPAPSSPTASRNSEEDTLIDNEQNTITTKTHKDLIVKKAKIIRPNPQASIELNAILEPAKQIFINNASNISIGFTQFKAIIENAQTCSDKQELCDNYKIEPNHLIKIIELVYPAINSKAIKNRLTRLSNALFELDIPEYEDNDKSEQLQ